MDFYDEGWEEPRYPMLEVDTGKLRENIDTVLGKCSELGIGVTGVIKGMNGIPELTRVYGESGFDSIGSSRIEQLRDARESGIDKPLMMIRVPMKSEAFDVVEYCDYSLNSESDTIRALNEAALAQGKMHKVILMVEMGDLREGFTEDEIIDAAMMVENELTGVHLAGLGMNVGCYGSVLPSRKTLDRFVEIVEKVEEAIWRKLEIVSGGATSSLMRVMDGDMPERINHLRIGEGILLDHDLPEFYGYEMEGLHRDVFTLKAEVIEVKDKPTYPEGEIGRDAFGREQEYVDRGIRKRALVAAGKLDYGDITDIEPVDPGIEVIGASSDHTILDVEDLGRDLKVGDKLSFRIDYVSMLFLTSSRNVFIKS